MRKTSKKQSLKKKNEKLAEIPLEISQQEFDELVAQVADLSRQEAAEELLECARYGEVDAIRAILTKYPDVVDTVDESGSTALHKAAANGHVSSTRLLVQKGASLLSNAAGNTPLHWAAASGHDKIVDILLNESSYDVDVLQKNSFGRSALTEGFASQCTEVVKVLLEHDSAAEDKLLSGGKEIDDTNEDESNGESLSDIPRKSKACVTHEFDFCSADTNGTRQPLCIRELSIAHADNPFGDSAVDDTTGYGIWCASLAMARWMASPDIESRFRNKTILELGAGCGVPGLAAAHYTAASRVYVTDLNPTTVDNLQYNVDLNFENDNTNNKQQRVIASTIDWDDETTWPKEKLDFVIGSDLIYQASIVPLLKKVVMGLLKPESGRFLYVAPDTGRDGLPQFIESMKSDGCELINVKKAPDESYTNPLSSGDDEDCFLHFNELAASTYILYEFCCENKD
jgi:hypothetical protein